MEYGKIESTVDGTHLYPLPPVTTEQDRADRDNIMAQLRAMHGLPDDWMEHPDRGRPWTRTAAGKMVEPVPAGWDVAIVEDPHPTLMDRSTVHDSADTPAPSGE